MLKLRKNSNGGFITPMTDKVTGEKIDFGYVIIEELRNKISLTNDSKTSVRTALITGDIKSLGDTIDRFAKNGGEIPGRIQIIEMPENELPAKLIRSNIYRNFDPDGRLEDSKHDSELWNRIRTKSFKRALSLTEDELDAGLQELILKVGDNPIVMIKRVDESDSLADILCEHDNHEEVYKAKKLLMEYRETVSNTTPELPGGDKEMNKNKNKNKNKTKVTE